MRIPLRLSAVLALASVLATAPITAAEAQSRSDTRVYAGLALSFGAAPDPGIGVVAGVRSIRVSGSNRLRGIDVNGRYDFQRGFDRIAAAGLIGRRSGYLNIGGGFNPLLGEVFVTGAVQARHVRAGVDYGVISGNAAGYFEVNTLRRPGRYVPERRAPAPNGVTPPNGDNGTPPPNGGDEESVL